MNNKAPYPNSSYQKQKGKKKKEIKWKMKSCACSLGWRLQERSCGLDRLWEANCNSALERIPLERSAAWSGGGQWRLLYVCHSLSNLLQTLDVQHCFYYISLGPERWFFSFTTHKVKLEPQFEDFNLSLTKWCLCEWCKKHI